MKKKEQTGASAVIRRIQKKIELGIELGDIISAMIEELCLEDIKITNYTTGSETVM